MPVTELPRIERASGPAIVVRGNDIDTDRILPARFLRAVTFEGLEQHLFEDDRREAAGRGETHPFDDESRRDARVLLVNLNFGCGSSREHAPQAILRRGIRVVIGESFAEIFFTNALTIGLPCVTGSHADVARLMAIADASPDAQIDVDLDAKRVSSGSFAAEIDLPDSARRALVSGTWDATALLLENYAEVERTAQRLPYLQGF
jgi:3-isopropylmalate/(R)-2-methylmalate dehydratase small subunit